MKVKNLLFIGILVCLLSITNAFAITYYVSPDGCDDANGTSWGNAFETLGAALSAASTGDDIWVQADTYTPGTTRSSTFQMVAGVDVYGGFLGTETSLSQRDWVENETTLSGKIGTADANDNCYHVVTGGVSSANLDGFTVTGGYADGTAPGSYGGGLFDGTDVHNCIFEDNYALNAGGGAWLDDSCVVSNCTFRNNFTDGSGGAAHLYGANVTFKNNLFYNNTADNAGGIYIDNSNPTFTNCTIVENDATDGDGGGLYFYHCSTSVSLMNNIIWGNTATGSGDQVFKHTQCSSPSYSYCDIEDSNGSGATWDTSIGTDDGNNIDTDPCFVDTDNNDFDIISISPCMNTGDPNGSYTGQFDIDSQPRVIGSNVDIGADEFASCYNADDDEYYVSIQAAFSDANNSDTIIAFPGIHYTNTPYYPIYSGVISFPNKSLTLQSIDPNDEDVVANTVINCGGDYYYNVGVHFYQSGTISGLTITNTDYMGIMVSSDDVTVKNCVVEDVSMGVFVNDDSNAVITNNKLLDNGYGVYISYAAPVITNNLIYSNGSGIFFVNPTSTTIIHNNTIIDNSYGVYQQGSNEPNITNCILWSNTTDDLRNCSATYSCIEDGDAGTGNISVNPNFAQDGYHLTSISACINAGDPNGNYSGQVDIDGQPRVVGIVDMGADESEAIYNVNKETYYSTIQAAINAASNDDTITVYPGTYDENLTLPDKNITLQGSDMDDWDVIESTIVEGDNDCNAIVIEGDCTIKGLKVTGGATGICCSSYNSSFTDANVIVSSCLIADNNGAYWGGGMVIEGTGISCDIDKCYFYSNHSTGSGGGIDTCDTVELTVKNSVFAHNSSVSGGGVNLAYNTDGIFENCTFYDNDANNGGGIYCQGSNIDVNNCIIWGNNANVNYSQIRVTSGSVDVSYSVVEDGISSANCGSNCDDVVGNIDADPCFVDASNDNFNLELDSPCIDAGDPCFSAPNETDIEGTARVLGYSVDMGAYEVDYDVSYNIDNDESYSSIQDALDDANDNDEIIVYPGRYYESIDFNGVSCTLRSLNPDRLDIIEATIIDANGGTTTLVTFENSEDANAVLNGFVITNNTGTGISCSGSSPKIKNCQINDNGRGIYCSSSASPSINNCIISENGSGSGMYNSSSSPTIKNCIFSDNTSNCYGGAMENSGGAPTIINCVFFGNSASSDGGAIYNANSSLTARNCTFSKNSDGAIYNLNSSPLVTITNCILWDNPDGEIINDYNSDPNISYCSIEDCNASEYPPNWNTDYGIDGGGNVEIDPCFNNADSNDFRITIYSYIMDRANGDVAEDTDILGNSRFDDPRSYNWGVGDPNYVDMGAYEYQGGDL